MDALLQLAQQCAQQSAVNFLPIHNRIAYVVSHGQSYASNGYAIRTQALAKALNEHGFEVLCFVKPGRPWELNKDITKDIAPEVIVDGVRYIHSRLWEKAHNAQKQFEKSVEKFIELFQVYRPSVVLAASNWIVGLPAWVAAKRLGIPFHNEVRGFWELSRDAREPGYADTEEYLIEKERDTFVSMQAESVFTLNNAMKHELIGRGVDAEKIHLVPNGVSELPEIKSIDQALIKQLGIEEHEKVVGYIGSFSTYEGLETLLDACAKLIEQGEKLKLLLVGDDQPLTVKLADTGKPKTLSDQPWVIQVGRVPHEQVGDYYALVDAIVIPRKKLKVCNIVPPMKVVEVLTYGKPLLVSDVEALMEYADKYHHIHSFKVENSESLSIELKKLLNMAAPKPVSLRMSSNLETLIAKLAGKTLLGATTNQRLGKSATIDLNTATYKTATELFYKQGNLNETLEILDHLVANKVKLDKTQRDFHEFVKGLARLQQGWKLPPRQPNAGLMTRRKHLLYCLHQSVPHATNGYSTRSHGIAVGLKESGWKVNATTRTGFPWDANINVAGKGYHLEEVDGITYTACAGWSLAKTPLDRYLAETADHFLREAQTSGAEVIVAASNHITALPALMAARRLGLPFVYEVRGLWEVTQASTQPEWMDSDRYHLMKSLESLASREADLVITLTEELADELVARGTSRDRIQVVPNAVDADRFKPKAADPKLLKQLNIKPNIPVIGYAGSAVAYEGLELLLEALAELKKAEIEFRFVLVGDGKVIDLVKAKAKALKIENECRFTGRIPFDQVPNYLACMDIMPIPRLSSAVTEMVSPLKPLEAMAMAKAVVLSNVSPHKVFAGNNERGRLFQKDSVASLTETLKELIANPNERERLGQAARQWIEKERTWNQVTSHYSSFINRLLHQQAKSRSQRKTQCKTLDQITIGLIADQFTTDTLASAVKVVRLSPDNWQQELSQQPIDAMFVESAWKGNDWEWHKKVGYYSDEEFAPLAALLTYCRKQGIPSLFWNKEDPVHFDRFRKAASMCDHVFTTDSRRIIPYLGTPNAITQTASSCPFYASPKIHNLLPSTRPWQQTAAYGGTYYGKRYPERTEYMDKIMSAAAPLGLTIYDRQHDDPESPYKYPGGLGGYVAGSLSYEEMIQAYKSHPVQINVNSVLDSPTMFSRRVVETAACGSPMISGPALGMNRYLENAGHVIQTESEAAQALENLMQHPAYRWRVALKGARAIMRAHTTELRLTQMLRTAGMVIDAPQPPNVNLVSDEITQTAVKCILQQTLRPFAVFAHQWLDGTKVELQAAGIQCGDISDTSTPPNSLWLYANPKALEDLEEEDLEDLAWPTTYTQHARLGFIRDTSLKDQQWPGVALEENEIDRGLQLLQLQSSVELENIAAWAEKQSTLAIRKPTRLHETAPNVTPKKTVVIAGHDLKFIKPFYPHFTNAGFRVLLDFWTGHNQHNEDASKRLIKQADTVFCEWTLGNAIWYGKHKLPGQKLVGRLHAQELRSALFENVPFERFERVIFVGPHMLRHAQKRNPVLKKNGVVIYNGVDVDALQSVPRKLTNTKVLGFVGIVPQSKRLDLALDILRELRQDDEEYIIRIKGKRPEEFAWMANRPDELAWYEAQYQRLENDPLLKGAVIFDPHGNDMPEWYAGIDFVLSTSDFESFHFTIADGAAAGCTPIILPWEGADEIYPKKWVYTDVKAAADGIKASSGDQARFKSIAKANFSIISISHEIIKLLN
ncbi:glycosyl transferase group 1 [Nitrincola tibetensis]|uniref:Glycosyl transferase group 1 n=1 Tax=Nitrincola tibetensis TaxID=2219697 RepID=A0A364NQ47_9GAMM|nr:glycosyltransferase [Nitrincola tibetensis]RAU19174.1 glycosyl transferase group 1 [Nitrincola tibetensis]